jgi:2-deoxy-D-gluconate 3-dehydrogenase
MNLDYFGLTGKVAIVTGVATGIGKGISEGLLDAGVSLMGIYHSHEPKEIAEYAKERGAAFKAVKMDLSDESTWETVIPMAVEAFGRVDILVNNAGICLRSPAIDHTKQEWDSVVRINESAVFFLSQAAARQFVAQGSRGKIINIASMLSFLGGFNCCSYTASKHAVLGLTRVMASEWGSKKINVNAIAPGWIKTNLSAPLRKDADRSASVVARIPMGEWGNIEDFKGVAVFLASDASNYINGVTIPVDGGYLTK